MAVSNPNPCRCTRASLCPRCYRDLELQEAEQRMREMLRSFGTQPPARPARQRPRLRLVPRTGPEAA